MRHYTGSLAFDRPARHLAVSGPRGDIVTIWDTRAQTLVADFPVPDGSGVAPHSDGVFLISAGDGKLRTWRPGRRLADNQLFRPAWDNHLIASS